MLNTQPQEELSMFISKIHVKNFRSLTDIELNLGDYTALVGLNDSGKSNLLRALNLFFNSQTDPGHELIFKNDFSQHAKIIERKAKQIEIEIEFIPPKNYADNCPIIWKKTYRADSNTPHEEFYKKDGTVFAKNSRTEYWVRHIAYEYVPAVRGKHFFSILKRRLYTTLASTVAPNLTKASSTFLSNLRREVKAIEAESYRLLQLKTEFSLPADIGDLFEALDFDSADTFAKTALQYRGDGIQGRHIPLILKFLADQRKKNSARGKPRSETIWGFEEPENNLELVRQVEAAQEFKSYSDSIQILISTHSPAFYGMAKLSGKISIAVRNIGKTSFVESVPPEDIDNQLGLMPFVQPYIEKAQKERDELITAIKNINTDALITNKPALYVEGSTDKKIITSAFAALGLAMKFDIIAKDGLGGGVNWVVDCCVARAAMTEISHKTAALFDNDKAGIEGKNKLNKLLETLGREGSVKTIIVGNRNGNDIVRKIKKTKISISFEIEELCNIDAWHHAAEKGWLDERKNLIQDNAGLLDKTQTFEEVLAEITNDDDVRLLIEHQVIETKKGNFANKVSSLLAEGETVPESLATLVNEINTYFS